MIKLVSTPWGRKTSIEEKTDTLPDQEGHSVATRLQTDPLKAFPRNIAGSVTLQAATKMSKQATK